MITAFLSGSASTTNDVLGTAGQVVTKGMEWLGDAATAVTNSTLLLTFACISLVGTGIGLLRRLIG